MVVTPPACKPVPPSGLAAFLCCELLDTIVQPYGIPTSPPPSTVAIAHAVRLIVFPSCGIPRAALTCIVRAMLTQIVPTTSGRSIEALARAARSDPGIRGHRRATGGDEMLGMLQADMSVAR